MSKSLESNSVLKEFGWYTAQIPDASLLVLFVISHNLKKLNLLFYDMTLNECFCLFYLLHKNNQLEDIRIYPYLTKPDIYGKEHMKLACSAVEKVGTRLYYAQQANLQHPDSYEDDMIYFEEGAKIQLILEHL